VQIRRQVTIVLALAAFACAQDYKLGPDSARQAGVPRGEVTKYSATSRIYPGTTHDYWIYVPAQYQPGKPAAVMVFLDGGNFVAEDGAWKVPIVFDNLIQRREMPVTIGVFINPGMLPALILNEPARPNRSFEYDTVTDRYSRFLLEEIMPEVERNYNLSKNPNDRAIGGSSSGGICAFTVAWQRPDVFRRVLSFVGSYTNLRGGEIYSSLVRKTEPKPIRVFLQDGERDLNIAAGNWFIGAHDMLSALEYAGYDVTHVWGTEAHNSVHGASILPDALRWLWRGYPAPIAKPRGGTGEREWSVLLTTPDKDWTLAGDGNAVAADKAGNVFVADRQRIYKVGLGGEISVFKENSGNIRALAFGPDGRLYACDDQRIVAYGTDGKESVVAAGVHADELVITARSEIYFADREHRIWLLDAKGAKRTVHEGIPVGGLRLSPGQAFLVADDPSKRGIWWFQVQADGGLTNGDATYRLEIPDESVASGAAGMAWDTEGFLYVATHMGVQVFDPPGRVMAILNPPQPGALSGLAFGGPNRDVLYVTSGGKLFQRPMRHKGIAE
jgi:predicted alpha/beta superfamily hydrolase/sugar lactone lactonase YvrE